MDHRGVAEHIAERPAQPLASVDHAQHTPVEREPAGQQVLQQLGAHHGVLRRAQAQSQRDLGPVARESQDHDRRLRRHHDAIHEQGHHLGCRVRWTTVRLTALLLLPRVRRPLGRASRLSS